MHAHICQKCATNGDKTIWIHSDDNAGNIQAHSCPKCGAVEWKQAIFHPVNKQAHVHRNAPVQKGFDFIRAFIDVVTYLTLGVGIAFLIYVLYEQIQYFRFSKLDRTKKDRSGIDSLIPPSKDGKK